MLTLQKPAMNPVMPGAVIAKVQTAGKAGFIQYACGRTSRAVRKTFLFLE